MCDDEVIECCRMAQKIKEIMREMKMPCMVRQFYRGRELIASQDSFDIIFLDIIMRGPDGMETARLFRERAFDKILIFMSSSREYVFDAYDVEAFQYLLKPVQEKKLKKVLQKAVGKAEKRPQEYIIVSRERQKWKLFLDDIFYVEIRGRVIDVHGADSIFTYYEQIGTLEDRLRGKGFFRCHKSYLINLRHVDGYNRQEVVLDNGERVMIAKRRYEEEISPGREGLFLLFSILGSLAINLGGSWSPIPSIFLILLRHLLFIGWVILLFQGSWEKKFLVSSLLVTIITLAENFFVSFFSCLALFWMHIVDKIPEPIVNGWQAGLLEVLSVVIVIWTLYRVSKHLVCVFQGKSGKWYVLSAVPLLAVVAVNDAASWGASNGVMVRSGGNMNMYYDQIFSHCEFLLLTVVSAFAAGAYVFGMNRVWLEQEKSSRYHSQIAVYKMLEEQYRQSERLRHDMKNHVIALSGLLSGKEWEKMRAYLENLADGILETEGEVTGSRAVDALLKRKRNQAEKEKIGWECDVQVPGDCGVHEFDLCVLFGNILDNALEACAKLPHGERRFIEMEARQVKKLFLLEGKNSMDRNGRYIAGASDKENPWEHGIGLLNVRDVVKRYNGVIDIEAEHGIFRISILLPLSKPHMTSEELFETGN